MATQKPKKPTPNQQEYAKQLRRIKRFISSAEKRGYIFPENVIPKTPQRITKASIEKLRKITPTQLYEKSKYQISRGRVVSGTEGRKYERHQSAKKGQAVKRQKAETQALNIPDRYATEISNVFDIINRWQPDNRWSAQLASIKENDKNIFANQLRALISEYGAETIAKNLAAANEKSPGIVSDVVNGILYGSGSKYAKNGRDEVQNNIKAFTELCIGRSLSHQEAMDLSYTLDENSSFDPVT